MKFKWFSLVIYPAFIGLLLGIAGYNCGYYGLSPNDFLFMSLFVGVVYAGGHMCSEHDKKYQG